ncbi:hypothetical protein ACWDG1_19310 [Streptomyces sp. NPDC001177]
MPQDVTFGLPFDITVSRHLEYVQEHHLCWIRDLGLVRGQAGVRGVHVMGSAAGHRPHRALCPIVLGRQRSSRTPRGRSQQEPQPVA